MACVQSSFTRTYEPDTPVLPMNFSNTPKRISCGIENIVNLHDSYSVRLARLDDTILDTQVLNDGTPFFLQFTELDYGTYDYNFVQHERTYTHGKYHQHYETHNSFVITLERDDGTVLQTQYLADGETSFTFTQTETSYATFNYVVKLNGTQTDTYSATYTPPPTPTFDIALTKDDLAITATLTNIVNPDPYYTFMIHDASDAHLDGHTFTTGDTTVTLTWTETLYGEKTYTKLLNGASIGTETITLTDPNAIELRQDFTITGGAWINESVVKETGGTNNTNGSKCG
ncbi:unnamed protein product [Bathycoccus prasinos]